MSTVDVNETKSFSRGSSSQSMNISSPPPSPAEMDIDQTPPMPARSLRKRVEVPKVVDPRTRYVIHKKLRQTIYGEVYFGTDSTTGKRVAIKVSVQGLRKDHTSRAGVQVYEDPAEEVALMKRIDSHPHIVNLVDTHEDDELHWVVQEFVSGGDLFDLLEKHGHFNESIARHFFLCLLAGMQHIHQSGFCHLDLSLENLLVDEQWNVKICDFGVARPYSRGVEFSGSSTYKPGKLRYMAPEIYAGKGFDGAKADVYSAGIVLFTLLTGHPPYEKPNAEDPRYKLVSHGQTWHLLTALRMTDRVPQDACDLIDWLLSENPADRPSTVEEIVAHPWLQSLRNQSQ